MSSAGLDCFAIAAPGLEPLVARELEALPVHDARVVAGGVEFRADAPGLAAVQVRIRTASRVVVRLARFRAKAFHELERAARQVEWSRVLAPGTPFTLRVTCRKSRLYHSDAVAERVAAAITRALPGSAWRSGVARDDDADDEQGDETAPESSAAQLFVVRFDRDQCTISADASGALLHRRGYRLAVARAPMRETLAAALVLSSGWDPASPLLDPFCGSGTIPIEAAMIARRIAPGVGRTFAAEQWPETPRSCYDAARAQAQAEALPSASAPIRGADRDEGAIAAARANAGRAGVASDIAFTCAPLSAATPAGPAGWIVTNPPYGVRVGESGPLRDLYAAFGAIVRERFAGWRVTLVSADRVLLGCMALPVDPVLSTRNGGLPVTFVSGDSQARRSPR